MQNTRSPDSAAWSSTDQSAVSAHSNHGNGSPSEPKSPGGSNQLGFLRGFSNPLQKKVTRADGQPAKRRGPKPDSKPAQTRRQELNRQAQRTHRERKEQYIKALEVEVSRLRELFVSESNTVQEHLRHSDALLHEQREENMLLREILASRNIPFENELQQRKAAAQQGSAVRGQMHNNLNTGYSMGSRSNYSHMLANTMPPTGLGELPQTGFSTGPRSAGSGQSPAHSGGGISPHAHHAHSSPALEEFRGIKHEAVSDMPGIFEKDPQLGIDFILALEETCRDHGEYLIRRSLNSPSDTDEALFSGHALMVSCPPPSHIERTPAQQGGLQPTYPHQPPQMSMDALNTLLNLSQKIKSEGYVEGHQVTPIMALQSLRGHSHYQSLTRDDVVGMIETIRNKVRCYGFGAVMEDFELRDALAAIFATKPEVYENFANSLTDEIDEMYS